MMFRMAAILLIFKGAKAQHGQHSIKVVTAEESVAVTFQEHKGGVRRNGCSSVLPTQPAQRPTQLRLQSHMEQVTAAEHSEKIASWWRLVFGIDKAASHSDWQILKVNETTINPYLIFCSPDWYKGCVSLCWWMVVKGTLRNRSCYKPLWAKQSVKAHPVPMLSLSLTVSSSLDWHK